MTWVEEHDTPGEALRALFAAFPKLLLKQLVDVLAGVVVLCSTLFVAQVILHFMPIVSFDGFGDALLWFLSVATTAEFVFFGIVTTLLWTFVLITIVVPENWYEFAEKEDFVGEATGVEQEFRRMWMKLVEAMYKTIVVLLATIPATLLIGTPVSWVSTLLVVGVPLLEMGLTRRGNTSPAVLVSVVFILALSPVLFVLATLTYSIRRSPDAAREAIEFLVSVLRFSLHPHPEGDTLLDTVFNPRRPGPPKNQ